MSVKYLNVCLSIFALGLSACGGGSDNDLQSTQTSDVAIRFSDAPIGELQEVVVTVDKLIFNREGEDIEVDRFTSEELNIEDADTFKIDLLEVQGLDSKLVLDSVILPVGDYQNLRIEVLDQDIDETYVMEANGSERKKLKVPSRELKLGGFTVNNEASQTFVVEFALNQAMTYNPGPDRYILKPRGVRIVGLEAASHISGTVDLANVHLREPCDDKADSSKGNVAYLYSGHNLDNALLGDLFVRSDDSSEFQEFDPNVPGNIIQPVASAPIDGMTGEFMFSYLNEGRYSLAISCLAENDDPVMFDNIGIPQPASQLIELDLLEGSSLECNFPDEDSCISAN